MKPTPDFWLFFGLALFALSIGGCTALGSAPAPPSPDIEAIRACGNGGGRPVIKDGGTFGNDKYVRCDK